MATRFQLEFTNFLFQSPVILLPSLISKMVWEIDYLVPLPCMGLHGKIVLLANTCTAPVPSSWKPNSKIRNGSTTKIYQDHKRICYHAFSDNNYMAYTWKLSVAIISAAAAAAACGSSHTLDRLQARGPVVAGHSQNMQSSRCSHSSDSGAASGEEKFTWQQTTLGSQTFIQSDDNSTNRNNTTLISTWSINLSLIQFHNLSSN